MTTKLTLYFEDFKVLSMSLSLEPLRKDKYFPERVKYRYVSMGDMRVIDQH